MLFRSDPVRLVHFLNAKQSERAVDLGTGNGIVPLYANALYGCAFTGVDVDEAQLHLGRLSAERNGQSIPFVALDVSEAPKVLGHGRFDLVTMNPPYYSYKELTHLKRPRCWERLKTGREGDDIG